MIQKLRIVPYASKFTMPDRLADYMRFSVQAMLAALLDTTLEACANRIGSSIAQRTFEKLYSRLIVRSAVREDWEEGVPPFGKVEFPNLVIFVADCGFTLYLAMHLKDSISNNFALMFFFIDFLLESLYL